MDETRFREAQQAYDAADWRGAAKGFLAAAGNQTAGSGKALHMAGNALMKLRRHADAVTVYRHALDDDLYERHGAVQANLGAALMAVGSYSEAVDAYRAALDDEAYPTSWRAAQGLGGALYEMGRFDEAAAAYERAAFDSSNPDAGKAFNNLGLAHMAAGKPTMAIEAYRAACDLDTYQGAGKSCANLGLAYSAVGRHAEAVKSFEKATHYYGYELPPAARAAFESSSAALAQPAPEIIEGWSTGEMPPVIVPPAPMLTDDPEATVAMPVTPSFDPDAETDFFTLTDDQMRDRDRAVRRAERDARRDAGSHLKLAIVIAVVVGIIAALFAGAWYSGLGFPTQTQTVSGLLEAHKGGDDVKRYWVAVPGADVSKEMAVLPPGYKSFTIDRVVRSATTSQAEVTVTLDKGAPLRYSISLAREGVGWKVNGVSNDWRSTGGGS